MMNFKTEFPDFPDADMPPMPPGFTDSSWHNNSCPSYWSNAKGLTIFIDYVDVEKREIQQPGPRFSVIDSECDDVVESDDWAVILAAVDGHPAVPCAYPRCKCIVQTSTSSPEPICPLGLKR